MVPSNWPTCSFERASRGAVSQTNDGYCCCYCWLRRLASSLKNARHVSIETALQIEKDVRRSARDFLYITSVETGAAQIQGKVPRLTDFVWGRDSYVFDCSGRQVWKPPKRNRSERTNGRTYGLFAHSRPRLCLRLVKPNRLRIKTAWLLSELFCSKLALSPNHSLRCHFHGSSHSHFPLRVASLSSLLRQVSHALSSGPTRQPVTRNNGSSSLD